MKITKRCRCILSIFVTFTCCLILIRQIFNPKARGYGMKNLDETNHEQWLRSMHLNRVLYPLTDMLQELKAAGCNVTLKSNLMRSPSLSNKRDNDGGEATTSLPPFIVPNVVHYVWLGSDLNFTLIHYLSFLSVSRHINPDYIFVHGEVGPSSGKWWNKAINEISNIYHVYGVRPKNAYSGSRFIFPAHESDQVRMEIIYRFGGIYVDADVIVLKSFDSLRRFSTTMGRERPDGICNGVIVGRKGAAFVRLLLDQYESYNVSTNEKWAYRSVEVPHMLSQIFPSWIHVEETTLNRPNCSELPLIYNKVWDWSKNYAIHTWTRMHVRWGGSVPETLKEINCAKTTIAEIGRLALYGSAARKCK